VLCFFTCNEFQGFDCGGFAAYDGDFLAFGALAVELRIVPDLAIEVLLAG
jgi:hypothetical protein